jgi:DNA-binding transcriptional MerR regulator
VTDDSQALLQARRVADLFGVTPRTLSNWEAAGVLTARVIRGRRYFLRSEVDALIERGHRRYVWRSGSQRVVPNE